MKPRKSNVPWKKQLRELAKKVRRAGKDKDYVGRDTLIRQTYACFKRFLMNADFPGTKFTVVRFASGKYWNVTLEAKYGTRPKGWLKEIRDARNMLSNLGTTMLSWRSGASFHYGIKYPVIVYVHLDKIQIVICNEALAVRYCRHHHIKSVDISGKIREMNSAIQSIGTDQHLLRALAKKMVSRG
jgi:hypothetical protein